MGRKKNAQRSAFLEAPNAGELDVYSVLWLEKGGEDRPMQLSEVFRQVCERRRQFGEPEPALTTISTHLRSLVRKDLLDEVTTGGKGAAARPTVRTRGGYTPPTRSPLTGYRAKHSLGEVLFTTFHGLGSAYPEHQRLDALLDFARALGLPAETMRKLEALLQTEQPQVEKTPS